MIKLSGSQLPNNDSGALTLPPSYLGSHDNGWEIVADIHADYYEWINGFVAMKHSNWGEFIWIAGDFEDEIYASSQAAYEEFVSLFPPESWNYRDI